MWEQLSVASSLQKYWADSQVLCSVTFKSETEVYDIPRALDYFQFSLKGISFLPITLTTPYPQITYEEITESQCNTINNRVNTSLNLQRDQVTPSFPEISK